MSDADQSKYLCALRYHTDGEASEIRKHLKISDNVFKKHRDAFVTGYNKELSDIENIIDIESATEKSCQLFGLWAKHYDVSGKSWV